MNRPPQKACGVCGLVLETMTVGTDPLDDREVLGWGHFLQTADHVAVPVDVDEIRTNFKCDFCMFDNARWTLPCEDYEVERGHVNRGDWAACDECAELLRADDWRRLIDRALALHRKRGGRAPRRYFVALYDKLKPHITGEVRLWVEGYEPR